MTSAASTVFETFARAARTHATRPWLCVTRDTAAAYGISAGDITYARALEDVLRLRTLYDEAGYGPGHRVGLLLENRPAFLLHWFALNALGVSIVPLNPDLRITEFSYVIPHSELVAIVAVPSRQSALRQAVGDRNVPISAPDAPPAPVTPGGPAREEAALLYTSGTTGQPKGCVLPNGYFLQAGQWYAGLGGLGAMHTAQERMLTPLPLFHMNALAYSAMAMLETGGCLIPLDRFHPRGWWATVRESRATVIHYLGVIPPILMADPPGSADHDHAVRFGFGAGVDGKLHAPFEQRFGFPLIEAWAMTETGAGAVIAAHEEPRHIGTCCFGRPAPEIECRLVREDGSDIVREDGSDIVREDGSDIVREDGSDIIREAGSEPGELLVRHAGPDPRLGFFREYLKDPLATAEAWKDGWFHTGDVVRRGPDGSLHFVDRRKNVIRRSGENIAAVEVESALRQHPAVAGVAVAPIANPVRGEEVFACIVTHAEPNQALAHEIASWCVDRLAYYKAPGFIAFVPELPLTSTQKIQRGELKRLVASLAGTAYDTRSLKRRQP
ncbi:AMP-binding protein [Rhodopila sp.]|uniref:AMP-binding protein n=1 Tax=Rhodopila sp. TaxID=2480087 RepID=UPI003D0CF35A